MSRYPHCEVGILPEFDLALADLAATLTTLSAQALKNQGVAMQKGAENGTDRPIRQFLAALTRDVPDKSRMLFTDNLAIKTGS